MDTGRMPPSKPAIHGLACILLGVFLVGLPCGAPQAHAQPAPAENAADPPAVPPPAEAAAADPSAGADGKGVEGEAAEGKGAEGLAADENAAPAGAQPAGGGQVQPEAPKSRVWWFLESSGAIGALILVLSLYFVATVGRLFIEMRQVVATPPELVDELMDLLQKRQLKEIYAIVKDDTSFFGRLLSTGIAELPGGLAEARDAMERVAEAVTVEMEKKISMLAVLGTLGPMIGLLGTLKGMIASFSVIALSDTQLKASQVAGGISEALLLTFEGVFLSVPAIYFYAVFRNRVSSISVATSLQADEFLRHFARAARVKTVPPTAAVAAPPKP